MIKSKLWSASEVWGTVPYNDIENEADKPKWIPVEKVKKAIETHKYKPYVRDEKTNEWHVADFFVIEIKELEKELGLNKSEVEFVVGQEEKEEYLTEHDLTKSCVKKKVVGLNEFE